MQTAVSPYYLHWASQGFGGSGKSHFLLTAPEPIWIALFDTKGIQPLLKKDEFKKKDIRWREYSFNPGKLAPEDRPQAAKDNLAQFIDDYQTALKHARTIGFDKEDKVYQVLRYARLEKATGKPASYGELNLEYQSWFADAAEAGVNLGAIRGMKEDWGQNEKGSPVGLGTFSARGQLEVNEIVQVVLHHSWDDDTRAFKVRIGGQPGDDPKCRVGPATELIGTEYDNLDFETLAMMLYPETADDMSVWGFE